MLLVSHNVQQRGHKHDGCYVNRLPDVVWDVVRTDRGVFRSGGASSVCNGPAASAVMVVIEQIAREGPCPTCGVLSSTIKDRPLMRVKDLPASGQRGELWWRKRRLLCGERLCPRR